MDGEMWDVGITKAFSNRLKCSTSEEDGEPGMV